MNLRSTLIGMFLIVALCGGSLYALQSYFSRESQMRNAERAFLTSHEAGAAAPSASEKALPTPPPPEVSWDEPEIEVAAVEAPGDEQPLTLDAWYASAGSSEGPVDPTPVDNDYLIDTAEPYSDGAPIG
ncbi:hypothetical protein [Erythrobacter sp. SD-21]|uniref:hypothetical protein n=1 Tax=Erythrobacter sp. SD-21 TaxID=161528 RepID=UPI000153F883|nr:hypothetical protein [Erythrobacter sp. SD-21]EDL49094.1 DNA mismatch repair protein [Erythrobacter sp. SD-21]